MAGCTTGSIPALAAILALALLAGCDALYPRLGVESEFGLVFAEVCIRPEPCVEMTIMRPIRMRGSPAEPCYPGMAWRHQPDGSEVSVSVGLRAALGYGVVTFGAETEDGIGIRYCLVPGGLAFAEGYVTLRW